MADFPALSPASRSFTPGIYPVAATAAMSGNQSQLLSGTAMIGSQLRLSFPKLSQSDRLAIEAHYHGQQSGFLSFAVPAEVLSGFTAADFVLTGYRWVYANPPEVADFCGPFYDVSIDLESVPDEGAWLPGMLWIVGLSLAAGVASGATPLGTINLSIAGGAVSPLTVLGGLVLTMAGGEAATADLGTIGLSFAPGAGSAPAASSRLAGLHLDGNVTDTRGGSWTALSGVTFITSGQKFGSGAASIPASDLITNNSLAWPAGSGASIYQRDFAFKAWVKIATSTGYVNIMGSISGYYSSFGAGVTNGQLKWVQIIGSGSLESQTFGTIPLNQWVFVEIGRLSGVIRGSVNGVVSSNTLSMNPTLSWEEYYEIGGGNIAIQVDDLEFMINEGPRTANFTPPTAAFS